jgi:hypothetical protein
MPRVIHNAIDLIGPPPTARTPEPLHDVAALAWVMTLVGLGAWLCAFVLPQRPPILLPMGAALALAGWALRCRAPGSRPATMLLFITLILGQLGQRWLETGLLHPLLEVFGGVQLALGHPATPLGALRLEGAVIGALLCVAMGCFVVRLDTYAVRRAFQASRT